MDNYRATEIAYKNGYEKGKAEAEATIRKLTEENTRLQTDYNELYETTTEEIKRLTEENERLRAEVNQDIVIVRSRCSGKSEMVKNFIRMRVKDIRADTVRMMQEMIKERCISGGIYPAFVARTIDKIAKEMLEEG